MFTDSIPKSDPQNMFTPTELLGRITTINNKLNEILKEHGGDNSHPELTEKLLGLSNALRQLGNSVAGDVFEVMGGAEQPPANSN